MGTMIKGVHLPKSCKACPFRELVDTKQRCMFTQWAVAQFERSKNWMRDHEIELVFIDGDDEHRDRACPLREVEDD